MTISLLLLELILMFRTHVPHRMSDLFSDALLVDRHVAITLLFEKSSPDFFGKDPHDMLDDVSLGGP